DAALVDTFVAVTVTPGSRPADASVTRPVTAPRNSCAKAPGAVRPESKHPSRHSPTRLATSLMDPPSSDTSRPFVDAALQVVRHADTDARQIAQTRGLSLRQSGCQE